MVTENFSSFMKQLPPLSALPIFIPFVIPLKIVYELDGNGEVLFPDFAASSILLSCPTPPDSSPPTVLFFLYRIGGRMICQAVRSSNVS